MTKQIQLTKGMFTLVDDEDFDNLNKFKWYAHWAGRNTFYAARYNPRTLFSRGMVYMHRFITGAPDGLEADHINGDGLDNRRCNLRLATHAENQRNKKIRTDNKSGFRGVSYDKYHNKWSAEITLKRKNKHVGYFSTPEAAAHAYDEAAKKHYGEFARLNFPEGQTQ